MNIDDDLIIQWEPKIQKMLSTVFVIGLDREDIAQELRIAIVKAAKSFDENRGVIFHTYLHTTFVNTIRSLISRVSRNEEARSLDARYRDTNLIALDILEALIDPTDNIEEVELQDYINSANLTSEEKLFLRLRLDGLTMEEITDDLKACRECIHCLGYINEEGIKIDPDYSECIDKNGDSSYKVRQSLREKFTVTEYDYQNIS